MEEIAQINMFNKGMSMDTHPMFTPENTYLYAENIRLLANDSNSTGCILNIDTIYQYDISYDSSVQEDEKIQNQIIVSATTTKDDLYVITKSYKNDLIYNIIWKICDFNKSVLNAEIIVKGFLNIDSNASVVINNESEDIRTMYVTDKDGKLKTIPLYNEYTTEITDESYFDMIPKTSLNSPKIIELVLGNLPSGMMQYCYQIFKLNGRESAISPLSAKIAIAPVEASSKILYGYDKDDVSNVGCKIYFEFDNGDWADKIRIIALRYTSNVDLPKIYTITEFDKPNAVNGVYKVEYIDTGSSFLNELTLEEFNNIVPFEFLTNIIQPLNNRLFSANISENGWDVDFDARAYRCNRNNKVLLKSTRGLDIDTTIDNILSGDVIIPKDHDCINPMNDIIEYPSESDNEYAFYSVLDNIKKYGGIGLNVRYEFRVLKFYESDQYSSDGISYTFDLYTKRLAGSKIKVFQTSISNQSEESLFNDTYDLIPNYNDPLLSTKYLSYQRDEVYRFGIIFYNDKMVPSPVHWIGDIRFPSSVISKYKPFNVGNTTDLNSFPIGLKFYVSNIPDGVSGFEIVRCDRTESDRTVVTLGLLGKTKEIDSVLYPTLVPSFANYYSEASSAQNSGSESQLNREGYFTFISPDVCFNKTNSIVKQNMYIVPQYSYLCDLQNKTLVTNEYWVENRTDSDEFGTLGEKEGNPVLYITNQKDMIGIPGTGRGLILYGLYKPFEYISKTYSAHKNSADGEKPEESESNKAYIINDAIVATNIEPNSFNSSEVGKVNIDYISGRKFTNIPIGNKPFNFAMGIGGIMLVLYSPKMFSGVDNIYYSGAYYYNKISSILVSLMCNIKQKTNQYGGNSYTSRLNSIYISTGSYCKIEDSKDYNLLCFGGDTYLGVLDYAYSLPNRLRVESKSFSILDRIVQIYLPVESSVNMYYRIEPHFQLKTNGSSANILWRTEPGIIGEAAITKPMYTYNAAYSNTNTAKKFVAQNDENTLKNKYSNRIICSEQKQLKESTDSWTKFKFANYLDVDNQYGQITNLKVFRDKLYYFLDLAVGVASVNERSLITDDNSSTLVLGTGTILGRYDYIIQGNGSSVINDKSIVNTISTMYWYDLDKNIICCLNDSFIELSKVKGVQSYLNSIPLDNRTHCVSMYNNKYNEVWFNLNNKSLIFNEQVNQFTSFYTHTPQYVALFSKHLVSVKDNKLFTINNFYNITNDEYEDNTSKLQFIVNKDYTQTKTFDNVTFDADFYLNSDKEIVKEIYFNTKNQTSGILTWKNIENREDNYRFFIPRLNDDENDKNNLNRMRGKYLVCNYTFDSNDGNLFKIPYIKTTYRYSLI